MIKNEYNKNSKQNSAYQIDATTEEFTGSKKLNEIWKKSLLRIANSENLDELLKGNNAQKDLEYVLSEEFSKISDFRIKPENCLLLRNKEETLRAVCIEDPIIPLYAPNMLFNINNNSTQSYEVNDKPSLKPEIGTNLEPGFFEYTYDTIYMVNSSYVIIQNPNPLTGRFLTKKEIIEIRDNLLQRKSVLIIDASLGQLLPDLIYESEGPSIVEGVIYLFNFSATGLSGNEINLIISNNIVINQIKKYLEKNPVSSFMRCSPVNFHLLIESIKNANLISFFKSWFKTELSSRLKLIEKGIVENLSYNYPVFIHKVDGGNSLWLYLKNLPLGDIAVTNLLKSQGLIVNPGSIFFPKKIKNWKHSRECIHLNINGFVGEEMEVIDILIAVISKCYKGR